MREIKFRFWDKNNKKMIFPGDIVGEDELMISSSGKITRISNNNACGDDDCCGANEDYIVDCSYYGYVLLQYTGLKDKNGKEIYEGDIVKNIENEIDFVDNYNEFIYSILYSEKHSGVFSWTQKEIEVIGNIYQNPELIK